MHILLFHFDESCPASVRQTFLLARDLSAGTAGDVTLVCTAGGFLEREARSVDVPVLPVGGLTGKPLTLMRLVRAVRSREAFVLHCCDTASAALVRQLKRLSGGALPHGADMARGGRGCGASCRTGLPSC